MKVRHFARGMWRAFNADNTTDVAAMMTYYAIFALFPMLVFILTISLLILPQSAIQAAVDMAAFAMPKAVADLVRTQVFRMEESAGTGFAIGSAALALWGASRGAASLMGALNTMFEVKKDRRGYLKRQAIALGVTAMVAVVLVIAVGLLAAGPAAGHALWWTASRWIGAAVLVMLMWATLYWALPDTHAPFRIFTPGAIAGVALWLLVTKAFGVYLDRYAGYEQTYGALASLIIFLTWLWLSNLMLLLGAQINDVLADVRGTGITDQERSGAEPLHEVPSTRLDPVAPAPHSGG